VSLNPAHGEMYSIQHYVIKFVSDIWQICGFLVSSTNEADHLDITEILLKVVLNTITLTPTCSVKSFQQNHIPLVVTGIDCTGNCKCNYHAITTMMVPSTMYCIGSSPGRVKPNTIKLVFVASPISTQH
jgi:hypothetical protein